MKDPIMGLPTLLAKFRAPVRMAKTVASIWDGVILANRTKVGRKEKASDIVSEKILMSTTKWMS